MTIAIAITQKASLFANKDDEILPSDKYPALSQQLNASLHFTPDCCSKSHFEPPTALFAHFLSPLFVFEKLPIHWGGTMQVIMINRDFQIPV